MSANATYVYCLVSAAQKPALRRGLRGVPGTGLVHLLDVGPGLWLVAGDAPRASFGEAAINRRLSDLDWVSRAAIAHERVVESFVAVTALLPAKLFTIFNGDERAVDAFRADRRNIDTLLKRVRNQQEWGVRVTLDRARMASRPSSSASSKHAARTEARRSSAGLSYLSQKKAQRDQAIELAEHARETTAVLYDRLAARSKMARLRSASELPVQGGPLLLDAAFLVPRARAAAFRALAAREARALARAGYYVTLTGPWPPYSFVKD